MTTALVLSGGGMFGAYQAGVWSVLSESLRPDVVVGTSVGALNGWAIAGGISGDELVRLWLDAGFSARLKWRIPSSPLGGLLDTRPLEETVRVLHSAWKPRTPFGVVLTELPRPRARLFRDSEISWRHLAASCAVIGMMRPHRINGRLYSDGGLLGALPLWAAAELGAGSIVAVSVMPPMPAPIRLFLRAARVVASRVPAPARVDTVTIAPGRPLGGARDLLRWDREKIERWIEMGRQDARGCLSRVCVLAE